MSGKTILWRRLDQPGYDAARLWFQDPLWCLEGTALFVEGKQICRLNYQIYCDTAWNTDSGKVTGWVGEKIIAVEFSAGPTRRWLLNGIFRLELTARLFLAERPQFSRSVRQTKRRKGI
jgi:hypothetical protein